jgi:uncharacterized protein (DUF2141 family)
MPAVLFAAMLMALPMATPAEETSSLHVIARFSEAGLLIVRLVHEKNFADRDRFFREKRLPVQSGKTEVLLRFDDLPAGTYALRVFIDQDDDGRLGRGLFGPSEPWALSWNGPRENSIPRFKDVSFPVVPGINRIELEVAR